MGEPNPAEGYPLAVEYKPCLAPETQLLLPLVTHLFQEETVDVRQTHQNGLVKRAGWRLRILVSLIGLLGTKGCAVPSDDSPPAFDVMERSITELNEAFRLEEVTSQDLVNLYLDRISAYDQQGPNLNTVITLNPRALEEAAVLDAERASGSVRGPLHGVPVLVKDNYDTVNMPTTAGPMYLA